MGFNGVVGGGVDEVGACEVVLFVNSFILTVLCRVLVTVGGVFCFGAVAFGFVLCYSLCNTPFVVVSNFLLCGVVR